MNYKLTPLFTEADIQKEVNLFIERVVKVLVTELEYLSLTMLTDARQRAPGEGKGFNDQTGNLRSSMFYRITYNGEILREDFKASPRGTDKATGMKTGQKYADKITNGSHGWAIVLGAGMDYASWVEAKGFDVITGATLGAQKNLRMVLENVKKAFE